MSKWLASTVLVGLALSIAGCDTVSKYAPPGLAARFGPDEEILPGERRAALAAVDPTAVDPEAAAVAVTLPPQTAAAEWSQPGGNAANDPGNRSLGGSAFSTTISAGGGDSRLSLSSFGSAGSRRLVASPIAYQGRIITMDGHGKVSAMGSTGGGGWTANLKPEKERSSGGYGGGLAGDSGRVIVATGYGQVHALDVNSGGVLWTTEMGSPARGAPTAANGKAYLVSADNVVHCYSLEDGTELWSYRGIPSTAGLLSTSSPAVSGNRVVVPYSSGEIIAFEAETGNPVWGDQLAGASRFSSVSGLRDVAGSPVISKGVVYAVGVAGRMIAVAEKNGERLWARNVASAHTPVIAGNSAFVSTLNGEVVALDRKNGNVRWKTTLPGGASSWAGPVLAGNLLWLGSSDGRVVTVNPVSGEVSSDRKTNGPVYIPPIASGGRVIILDDTGRLTGFN